MVFFGRNDAVQNRWWEFSLTAQTSQPEISPNDLYWDIAPRWSHMAYNHKIELNTFEGTRARGSLLHSSGMFYVGS